MALEGVCIAFDDDALAAAPTWTRLDDPAPGGYRLVDGWTIDRGRQGELDKTGTGTAQLSLLDREGVLDPTNLSSPIANKMDPARQVAICLRNPVAASYGPPQFRGHVAEWQGEFDQTARWQKITVECEDGFGFLSEMEMTPSGGPLGDYGDTPPVGFAGDVYFRETTGPEQITQRMDDALDAAGWPAGWRRLFTGNVQLQATSYSRLDQLLTVLQDAGDAEFPGVANVFCSKDGLIVHHGRFARFDPHSYESVDDASRAAGNSICFWQAGTRDIADLDPTNVAPLAGLAWRRSRQDIITAAICLPKEVADTDVPSSLVSDAAAVAKYGWRQISFEDLLTLQGTADGLNAVQETKLYATYFLENYKTPRTRITQLTLRSRAPEEAWAGPLWALICGVEIGDVISVNTNHFPDGLGGYAGGFAGDYFVEGIHYDAKPLREGANPWPDLTLTLDVSPAAFYTYNPFTP